LDADLGVYRVDDGYCDAALPRSEHLTADLELFPRPRFCLRRRSLQGLTAYCMVAVRPLLGHLRFVSSCVGICHDRAL